MSFSSISIAESNDTHFAPLAGFSSISIVSDAVYVNAVTLNESGALIDTFQIENAVLQDVSGVLSEFPLTFAANSWGSNESLFYYGISPENIRIKFDISGLTVTATPFSLTNQVIIPTLTLIP
jgi:hypothetical protein